MSLEINLQNSRNSKNNKSMEVQKTVLSDMFVNAGLELFDLGRDLTPDEVD